MTRMRNHIRIALGFALALALTPGLAYASDDTLQPAKPIWNAVSAMTEAIEDVQNVSVNEIADDLQSSVTEQLEEAHTTIASDVAKTEKLLSYDPAAIAAIGTQESTGHSICCPSFSCAYADAVLDGTIHSHEYYTCSCCTWTDWGGGDSSDRCVGSDEQLLREAYDQITSGKPTVIHVSWSGGEHWIALIGYQNATDPDHLTLANFIALDPWDGVQMNAASKYSLYGDSCEHISSR